MANARSLAPFVVALATFAVPFVLFDRLILFDMYQHGELLHDTGLLASLIWHAQPSLPVPSWYGGQSFFAIHVAPLLLLVSALGALLPLTPAQTLAAFVGISHGLLALALFALLVVGEDSRRAPVLALASVASVGFASLGLALDIALFPHFETFGAACLLLTFAALVRRRRALAAVCFLLALATREDIGLHGFGFLALWAAANRWRGVAWRNNRWVVGFALAGLLYSTTALIAQHTLFPAPSAFARTYLGTPPFAHLSWSLVAGRLRAWADFHATSILLPAAVAAIWAVRTRDPVVWLGFAACIPWAVLQLVAFQDLPGLLAGYYAYPFLIALAWPPLAGLIRREARPDLPTPGWPPGAAMAAISAIALLPLGHGWNMEHIPLPDAFLLAPTTAQQSATEHVVAILAAAPPDLGALVVDDGIASLAPRAFARPQIAIWAHRPPDTIAYFPTGLLTARFRPWANLPRSYRIAGTALRLDTNRPAEAIQALGIPLEPSP